MKFKENMQNKESFSPEIFLDEKQEAKIWKMQLENEVARTIDVIKDFKKIRTDKSTAFDIANWDLRKTEICRDDQKIARAATACADIAKNIVVIASVDHNIRDDNTIDFGMSALNAIVNYLQSTSDCSISPLNDGGDKWVQLAEDGLRNALLSSVYQATYSDGCLINTERYIQNKFAEIQVGINIRQSLNNFSI